MLIFFVYLLFLSFLCRTTNAFHSERKLRESHAVATAKLNKAVHRCLLQQPSYVLCVFLSLLYLKIKRATHFSHSGIKKPFSEVALQTRESLKRPYFSLPLSILAGTNLIMLLLFFCNPRLIPKKIHPPFDFRENSSSFDFRENPSKNPKENQKSLRFLDPF